MKNYIVALLALGAVGGLSVFFLVPVEPAGEELTPTACTEEAKICPDGSAVGRTGPKCEFAACPIPTTPPVLTATSSDLTLGVGQTGKFGNLQVTFNHFVQDSRCPIDVQCIQAGAVNINVTFAAGPHTETKNMPSDEVPQKFDEYRISIVGVDPPARSTVQIPPSAYKITFRVTK